MEKNIAVLSGDGIGPEVIAQALKVLVAIEAKFNHTFNTRFAYVGAVAIDLTGDPLPQETLDICMESDAVLFGAIGHPKYDNDPSAPVRPEQGLLRLRKSLGLFANVRPVTTYQTLLSLSPLKEEKIKAKTPITLSARGVVTKPKRGRKICSTLRIWGADFCTNIATTDLFTVIFSNLFGSFGAV